MNNKTWKQRISQILRGTAIALATLNAFAGSQGGTVIYTLTNDPVANGNAIAAYRQNSDGSLAPLSGSPFKTGGAGWKTDRVLPHFGPFDLDQAVILSPDKKRLFAVNGGSDSIAVFNISDNGSLSAVAGSPFPSGGKNPVSIGYAGDYLVVVNKNEDPSRDMTQSKPNYSVHKISADGALTLLPKSTLELSTSARSPTQALIVDNHFVYDGDFGSFFLPAREAMWGKALSRQKPSMIRVLELANDGSLKQIQELEAPKGVFDGGLDTDKDGTPDPLMFGLQAHPSEPLIYVSMVTGAKLGVFERGNDGRLSFVGATGNSGELICWVAINKAGTRAYTTNNGSDTVSVYDLSDPRHPKEMQHLDLRGYGAPYQLALSPDERYLYTVKHRTFDKTPVGDGGTLNVVEIGSDGKISENQFSPYNVPNRGDLLARPLGLATR